MFDRTRRLSLNMFEHVHGESRDRGQAMVEEHRQVVRQLAGFDFEPSRLVKRGKIEFLATRPLDEARALVVDAGPVLSALETRLAGRNSPYAAVLAAVRSLAGAQRRTNAEEPAPPDDFAALDAAWEEEAVRFGPGAAKYDCAVDRLRTRVRAERRDAWRLNA